MKDLIISICFFAILVAAICGINYLNIYKINRCVSVMSYSNDEKVPRSGVACVLEKKGFLAGTCKYIVSLADGGLVILSGKEIDDMHEEWEKWSEREKEKALRQKILENFKKK